MGVILDVAIGAFAATILTHGLAAAGVALMETLRHEIIHKQAYNQQPTSHLVFKITHLFIIISICCGWDEIQIKLARERTLVEPRRKVSPLDRMLASTWPFGYND